MTPNLPFAIAVAVGSSLCFAAGSTVQGSAVGRHMGDTVGKERLGLSDIPSLLKAPRWLAGLVLAGLGSALNVVALLYAPVSVVQPMGVLAVPGSALLAWWFMKRHIPRLEWAAIGAALLGTIGFISLSAVTSRTNVPLEQWRIPVALAVVWAAGEGLGMAGKRGPAKWRSLSWALGGAFYYGLEAALIKTLSDLSSQVDTLHSPLFWAMAPAVVFGALRAGWMIQQAYATGPSGTVVGALTVTNPVVAVAFGWIVLQEGGSLLSLPALGMLVSGALAIGGVIVMSQIEVTHRDVGPGPLDVP